MKFKKLAAAVMAGTLSVFTITGCSEQANNYSKETTKINSWAGVDSTIDGTINMSLMGQSIDLKFNADGYMNGKDKKCHVTMKFEGDSQAFKIPDMDIYTDKSTAYINKSYFTSAYTNGGIEIPKQIEEIPAQYIGIDSGVDVEKLSSLDAIEALDALKKQFIGDVDIDIPMTQVEREYTVNLNDEQIADIAGKIVNGVISNIDNINLGMNEEAVKQIKAAAKTDEFKNSISNIKEMIKGSSITSTTKFEDDSYTSNMNIDLKVKDLGSITMKVNSKSTKTEAKEVEIPLGRVKFTQRQYMETFMPAATVDSAATEAAVTEK